MMINRIRPGTIVLFAALLLIGACSGDSPTAPPPGGGGGTGGGTPPPTSASISLEVSNTSPLVNSTSTITATVTENGNPVPDGTAIEFETTFGTFVVGQSTSSTLIRTTVDGKAVVTITSTAAGQAVVTARVNNVSQQAAITFREQSTEPPPPGEPVPTITTVSPQSGPPEGGTVVTLRGQNFEGPVRVMFGDREATIASVTSTEVRAISPPILFDVGEELREVPITVIFEAGTTGETAVQAPSAFRYQLEALTPQVIGISPSSGPNEGGTVVSIIGSGFQAPAKVYFIDLEGLPVEAPVQQVLFNQIIALTPKASGLGVGLANQFVSIKVVNTSSGKEVITDPIFRFGPTMRITGFGPGAGPATGGTQVTIFGWGFDDPVAVTIGGIAAVPIKVSGTEIVARTAGLASPCSGTSGEVSVTNLEDGTSASAEGAFEFIGIQPAIIAIAPSATTPGSNVNITVANAGPGNVRFTIGGEARPGGVGTPTASGDTVYTVSLPLLQAAFFDTEECGIAGERYVPTPADVTFQNLTTGCSDGTGISMTVNPLDASCRNQTPPTAELSRTSVNFGPQAVGVTSAPQSVSIRNVGSGTLTVTGASSSDPQFAVTGTFPANLANGQSTSISIRYTPAAAGNHSGEITIETSVGPQLVTVSGSGI